ncbi:solute carrier family 53 member 1-like [Musca vetustissima]|uniref:solute carrier family 53 member 1-like n=1 Tax=Musca vetustissima TaxID=27455 RepID=UPI002AB5E9F0|nr:solute carrier family 53 member 1-like [Musca vetustissima]
MKFSEKLGAHLTPEWRQQYISYVDLKNMILNVIENAPISQIVSSRVIEVYNRNFEEEFFFECEKELRKINTFYAEKLAEATRRSEALATSLDIIGAEFRLKKRTQSRYSLHANAMSKTSKKWKKAKMDELRNAYSELYLSLVLLQNYKVLNHTGFRKILKKHDKLLNNDQGGRWFAKNVDTAYFYKNKDLDRLIEEAEYNVTEYLENGDRAQAMKRLRVPPLEETQDIGTVFRVGFFMGAFTVLLAAVFLTDSVQSLSPMDKQYGLLLFRGPFYVIMYLFLLGVNVLAWRQYGVNHILIFEINPRKRLTSSHLLELHGVFGVLWSLCVLGFVYGQELYLPRYGFPLIFLVVMMGFLFIPLPVFHLSGRLWLMKLMGRVCAAPFFTVGFADFWFGDQLNSLVCCLLDLKYMVCFYSLHSQWGKNFDPSKCLERDYLGNAIIRCLPSWFRFAQSVRRYRDTGLVHPFLVNAGKYFTTFPTVIFGTLMAVYKADYPYFFDNPFVWCYILADIVQSLYCYSWDILRDFSLFENFSGKNIFLRDQIIYPAKFYYFVIVQNLFLRFFWVISMFMTVNRGIEGYIMDTIAGCLEIFRRYLWNYIRLENEHLFNVGQFRAVRDIFIAPIEDDKSSINLERMMDEEDGVTNRKRKIKFQDDDKED